MNCDFHFDFDSKWILGIYQYTWAGITKIRDSIYRSSAFKKTCCIYILVILIRQENAAHFTLILCQYCKTSQREMHSRLVSKSNIQNWGKSNAGGNKIFTSRKERKQSFIIDWAFNLLKSHPIILGQLRLLNFIFKVPSSCWNDDSDWEKANRSKTRIQLFINGILGRVFGWWVLYTKQN